MVGAHCYLDRDNSGTHFSWPAEVRAGVTVQVGVQRLQSFVTWLTQHGQKGHLGEMGIGDDDQGWFIAFDNALAVVANYSLQFTYWAGGAGRTRVSLTHRHPPSPPTSAISHCGSPLRSSLPLTLCSHIGFPRLA